jgi:hypothetical protein
MSTVQFINSGVGDGNVGKKANNNATQRYRTDTPLIQIPAFPKLKWQGSKVSFFHRFRNIQEMEMMYEENNAQVPSEAILLKATVLPILIKDKRIETTKDTRTELSGISQPGRTRERKEPNGTPWSRAKAKSCLEHVATLLTHPKMAMITVMVARTVAPVVDWVALYMIWICGWPVGVESTLSTSPRQKQKVMSIKKPRLLFTTAVHIMALGSVFDASWSSSLICVAASAPSSVIMGAS